MLCRFFCKYNESSKRMVWLTIPCKLLRAVQAEGIATAAKRSGGIAACMEEQVSLQRQVVRGAFKCIYWLAKEETLTVASSPGSPSVRVYT